MGFDRRGAGSAEQYDGPGAHETPGRTSAAAGDKDTLVVAGDVLMSLPDVQKSRSGR